MSWNLFASALATIRTANYEALLHAEEVNTYLRWLNRIDNSDWIPIVIVSLSRYMNEPKYVAWFINMLERLAVHIHVYALNIIERVEQHNKIIETVE